MFKSLILQPLFLFENILSRTTSGWSNMLQAQPSDNGGLLPSTSTSSISERFSVRWKGFGGNVASALEELHQNGDFADITLVSGDGTRVECHRLVLSAGSTYFKRILVDIPYSCCQHPVIILPDVKGKVLNAIVCYLYNGETNVDHGMLEEFLQSASGLNVKGMVHQYPLDDGQLTPPREDPTCSASAPNLALLSQTALTPDLSSVAMPPSFNFLNMQPPLPTMAVPPTTSQQQQQLTSNNMSQSNNGLSILALAAVTSQATDRKRSDADILSVQKLLPRQRMRTEDTCGLLTENDENNPMNSCGTNLGSAINLSTKDINSLVSRAPSNVLPSTTLALNQLRPIAPPTILSSIFDQKQATLTASATCRPIHQPIVPPHLLTIPNPSSVLGLVKQHPTLSLSQGSLGLNADQPSPPAQAIDMSAHANNSSISPRPPTSMSSQIYTSVASPFGGSTGSCGRSVGESPENPPSSTDGGSPLPFTQLGNGHSLVAPNSYSNLALDQTKKIRKTKKKIMKDDNDEGDDDENMDKEERGDKAWKSRQPRSCGHCGRVFSNKFNLKQVKYIVKFT